MPPPASQYQPPLGGAASTATPAAAHSSRSRLWVPLSSPRETNGARARAMRANAAAAPAAAAAAAGSAAGPASTKSLYIRSRRARP